MGVKMRMARLGNRLYGIDEYNGEYRDYCSADIVIRIGRHDEGCND